MDFVNISEAQGYLRGYQAKVAEMLKHFDVLRKVRGSGIKNESCCAVALQGASPVYGNSQAYKLDQDASELGKAHAEVVAYELAAAGGDNPRVLFCELSPCPACVDKFEDLDGRIIYLFSYPDQIDDWKAFHGTPIKDQIAVVRKAAGLDKK